MTTEQGGNARQDPLQENLENDALLATDTGAAPQRACSLKRVGLVAVPLACAVLAATVWASSTPALRAAKDLLEPEYNMPEEVDDLDAITVEASDPNDYLTGGHAYSALPVNDAKAKSGRCILCNPNECTLDYSGKGSWTSCPVHAPYFSEAHCKCVKSNVCQDDSPVLSTCRVCPNCANKPCAIGGKSYRCPQQTPYYLASKKLCSNQCQPPPGPAPPPYTPWLATTPPPSVAHTDIAPPPTPGKTDWAATTPPSTACKQDTGGQCSWFGCSSSRKATCKSGKCICDTSKGLCAKNGKCVKASIPSSVTSPPSSASTCKSGDTGVSCRWADCDKKLGKTVCDGMVHGMGSYKCKCKLHYCYDTTLKKCVKST